jgi:hypothetical protein
MRARPAGPAQSSVFHNSARRGPTKEAHRRALNRPDGLLRSVAGQGHGRFLPVTLPRGASDQGKRTEAGTPRSPTPGGTHQGRGWGTHQGRDQGTPTGTHPGRVKGTKNRCAVVRKAARNSLGNSASGRVRGPKSASARPGPCTRPRSADALTRRDYHPARQAPASSSFVLGRQVAGQLGRPKGLVGGLRALQLDPGSGRMVPVTRVGRSALRAAAPAGRGRCRTGRRRAGLAVTASGSPGLDCRPRSRWRAGP